MAAALPALKFAAPFIAQGVGALLGKKKSSASAAPAPYTQNPAYTKPLTDFGGSVLPMAQQGFQKSFDYYGNVLNDPAAATASDAASIGRQSQQATQRAARLPQRGGASAYSAAQIPGQAMTAGLERRLSAQQGAAANIGQLAGTAGGLGANIFGNLLGNQLGGYQASSNAALGGRELDLRQTAMNRDWYGKMGGSIFDVLTGKRPGSSDEDSYPMDEKWPGTGSSSPWDKIMGIFKGSGNANVSSI